MVDPWMLNQIQALVRDECLNYADGLCTVTNTQCALINTNDETISDDALCSDCFLKYVIPVGWSLADLKSYAQWYNNDPDEGGMK